MSKSKYLVLAEKIIKSSSPEEVKKMLEDKQIGAIKLSDEEMKLINGGGFWAIVRYILRPVETGNDTPPPCPGGCGGNMMCCRCKK